MKGAVISSFNGHTLALFAYQGTSYALCHLNPSKLYSGLHHATQLGRSTTLFDRNHKQFGNGTIR
jgi:hypothetical protein